MKKVYLIPGLGFDRRIFQKLDLGAYQTEFLDWIEPLNAAETLQSYASRMAGPISAADENILIGHSLGGILSQQIASLKPVSKIILISSIRSRQELPGFFRLAAPLGLHHLLSKRLILSTFRFWAEANDYRTKEEKELFRSMVAGQSDRYLQWALKQLSNWQGKPQERVIQVMGDRDKTFPINLITQPDHLIPGGGHFMVFNRASEISVLLEAEL